MNRAEAMIKIYGSTHALRILLLQVRGDLDDRHVATHGGDMQILVERLRGPETAGVRHTQVDILRRIEAHVRTRAKDHMIHHVMLIQTATDQETPTVILPLVLGESATDMHGLGDRTVIAKHLVLQIIVAIFGASRKGSGHKKAFIPFVGILGATDKGHVRRVTIGVRIFSGTVITLAFRMLGGGIHIQPMMVVAREKIEFQASPVDLVVGLLGDIRLVRRKIQ